MQYSLTEISMLSFQEGSSHDRGLYLRCFEELFDLSNSDTTSTSHFNFYFTACELYNDQVLIQFCQWNSTNDHLAVVPCQMNMTALSLYSWSQQPNCICSFHTGPGFAVRI